MLALPFLPLLLWSTPAHAQQHGLVVRLDTDGVSFTGPAVVILTPTVGEPTRLEVKDDGVPPDVGGNDGVWSGSVWLEGDAFTVGVEVGGKTLQGGTISWNATDDARDLQVMLKGDTVVAEAGVSAGGVAPTDPAPGDGGAPGAPGSEGGAPASGPGASGPGASGPGASNGGSFGPTGGPSGGPASGAPPLGDRTAADTSNDGTLYIGFGLGVLVLVGVAWLWLRNRPAEGGSRSGGLVVVVPEPGLLGPGTPSLSDGLSLWLVPAADTDALVRPLLATLARHHRVLFAAPSSVAAPAVHGGPVYRATNLRPSYVGDAAELLQQNGGAVAVLFVGTQSDAATLKDYADLLPTGVGSICILEQDPGVPALARVTAERDNGAWSVKTAERTLRLVEGRDGALEETTHHDLTG